MLFVYRKSCNVYEVIVGEEILKEDLFLKLNYVEMSCVLHVFFSGAGDT